MGAVDDYLESVEDPQDHAALARILEIARELAPDAEQDTRYRMPALTHQGKALISAIRAAKHLGVYPFSADAVAAVADRVAQIEGASTSTGAIRLAPGSDIPEDLIRDLVAFRLAQIDDADRGRSRGVAGARRPAQNAAPPRNAHQISSIVARKPQR